MLRGVKKLSGKTPYKKTQLKTLITFDRVMVLTSNLVHILLMSKDVADISIFYDDVMKILTRQKQNNYLNLYIHKKTGTYVKDISITFQNI